MILSEIVTGKRAYYNIYSQLTRRGVAYINYLIWWQSRVACSISLLVESGPLPLAGGVIVVPRLVNFLVELRPLLLRLLEVVFGVFLLLQLTHHRLRNTKLRISVTYNNSSNYVCQASLAYIDLAYPPLNDNGNRSERKWTKTDVWRS